MSINFLFAKLNPREISLKLFFVKFNPREKSEKHLKNEMDGKKYTVLLVMFQLFFFCVNNQTKQYSVQRFLFRNQGLKIKHAFATFHVFMRCISNI